MGMDDHDEHRARHARTGRHDTVPRSARAQQLLTAPWWRRAAAAARCAAGAGHCLHLHADASPMEPEWYCCECPRQKAGFPAGDCQVCVGPGCGCAP